MAPSLIRTWTQIKPRLSHEGTNPLADNPNRTTYASEIFHQQSFLARAVRSFDKIIMVSANTNDLRLRN